MGRVVTCCAYLIYVAGDGALLIASWHSTKLDADKRLELQQEKEGLEAKLLEVCVHCRFFRGRRRR